MTDPAAALLALLAGKWIAQAVSTAARLGLAEHLDTPRTVAELARLSDCNEGGLGRLVAVLVGEGLLTQDDEQGTVALTETGRLLRRDELGVLAAYVGSPSQWTPWAELPYSVRTGKNAFERVHGMNLFDWLSEHPEEARLYDAAIDVFTTQQGRALAADPVLDGVGKVVDVGGGRGTVLRELLRRRPPLRGILFDRPDVVEAARKTFGELSDRCEFVGGDFLQAVPRGADAYVIKHVLHNWDDDEATALLRRCVDAMTEGGKILVVESVLLPGSGRNEGRFLDLEMLAMTVGGKERSKPQLRRLLAAAGLKLVSTTRLAVQAWLLVAEVR